MHADGANSALPRVFHVADRIGDENDLIAIESAVRRLRDTPACNPG